MKLDRRLPFAAVLIALGSACYDPVHADDVASLGDERPGIPRGPLHRGGQRCTTCHGGEGPGDPEWSVAGTVYASNLELDTPEVGATVTITDKLGTQLELVTNGAGNFYVDKAQWDPIFPLKVGLRSSTGETIQMKGTIGRDGGCGTCHRGGGDRQFAPRVFMRFKRSL